MGLFTELLELAPVTHAPAVKMRRTFPRLPVSGTLLGWGLGIGAGWTVAVLVLAYAVRF